jgi:hypothetical protein
MAFLTRLAALLLLTWPSFLDAAEISEVQGKVCHLLLAGDIEPGDAERLENAVSAEMDKIAARSGSDSEDPAKLESDTPRFIAEDEIVSLCLNSPGGSYSEALKIVDVILSTGGLATVVDADHECLSACALVFMFGHIEAYHEDKYFDRRLHIRGKLGFHAPYIQELVEGSLYPFEKVAKGYSEGIQAYGRLLELDRNEFLARGLTIAFMKIRPQDFLYVDTVDRAGEWSIELFGHAEPRSLTERMVAQACDNEENWEERRKTREFNISRFVEKRPPNDQPISLVRGRAQLLLPGYGAEGGGFCVVRLQQFDHERLGMELRIKLETDEIDDMKKEDFSVLDGRMLVVPGFGSRKPLWFVYPPDTKLIDMPGRSD